LVLDSEPKRRLSVNRFIINEKNGEKLKIWDEVQRSAHRHGIYLHQSSSTRCEQVHYSRSPSRESGAEALKAAATELKTSDHRFRCLSIVRNNGYSRV
jgi:hypothetical protein